MVNVRRTLLAASIAAGLLAAGGPLAVGHSDALAASGPVWGISDQDPNRLGEPLYAGPDGKTGFAGGMKQQGREIRSFRIIVPYDTVSNKESHAPDYDPRWLPRLDALKLRVGESNMFVVLDCKHEGKDAQKRSLCPVPPSPDAYRAGFAALRAAYPKVPYWGAWNEPDGGSNGTHRSPSRAAQYWAVAQKVCGKTCQVVAGEFANAGKSARYIANYQIALKKAMKAEGVVAKPAVWSFHPYKDIMPGGGRETKSFHKRIKGSWGSPQLWLSEVGVCLICGNGVRTPGLADTNAAVAAAAQAQTALNLITIAKTNKVARVYYYSILGSSSFDSGLQGGMNGLRPAYCVLTGQPPAACPDVQIRTD